MSNVSITHNVHKLDKKSTPLTGQRLARIIAKQNKDGLFESEHLTESKCISVPRILDAEIMTHLNTLLPHIGKVLEIAQDALIRERIALHGATSITDDDISIRACIEYLETESKGSRLTKEILDAWFNELYAGPAMEFICTMNNWETENLSEVQLDTVVKKVAVLSSMFSGFSGGKYSPDIPKCKAMVKFGEFLGAANMDSRMETYVTRAAKIREEKMAELSTDALGF